MRVVKAGKNKSFLKTLNIRKHKAVVHESKSISTLKKTQSDTAEQVFYFTEQLCKWESITKLVSV